MREKAPNLQVPCLYHPPTSLPSPTLRLFCTSPIRNTPLIACPLNDYLVLFVQQPTISSHRTPFISAQLLQTSAPLKHSPKSPIQGPSSPPDVPHVHLLHPSSATTLRVPGFLITLGTGSGTTYLPSPQCPQLLIHHFSFSSCMG